MLLVCVAQHQDERVTVGGNGSRAQRAMLGHVVGEELLHEACESRRGRAIYGALPHG